MRVKSRREEYSEATRHALLASARELFAAKGYGSTSIDDIAAAARVTRGAFYHHFDSKQSVFEHVLESVHDELKTKIASRMSGSEDLWEGVIAGLDAFLDACVDEQYQRIALQEAPVALGYKRWRELDEQRAFGLVRGAVSSLMEAGLVERGPVDVCARVLFGAFVESALAIGAAPDRTETRNSARTFLLKMLYGLRATSDPGKG